MRITTAELLASGGDERIDIAAPTGRNRYGCTPHPDPDLLAFGSSTATPISEAGFHAAELLHDRLLSHADRPPQLLYAEHMEGMRQELARLCDFRPGTAPDIIFAASGTDLHLIAALLSAGGDPMPLRIIMADADETGSGVPMAVTGRHFSNRSALGCAVEKNSRLSSGPSIELANVRIRSRDGTPRPSQDIDDEVASLAKEALRAGRRVLVIVVDVSKTGMIAPSPQCAFDLRDAHPGRIDVMIDACQFRLAPASLHAYIAKGAMVALTGSKFVTGPSFCGALLIPKPLAAHYQKPSLPAALSAYSVRADWSENWKGASTLRHEANFGLLLRWEAALSELKRFRAIPDDQVAGTVGRLGAVIEEQLSMQPGLRPLPVPRLDRGLQTGVHWDDLQTIYPFFMVRRTGAGKPLPLTHAETASMHRILQSRQPASLHTNRCQLGQPVVCGEIDGIEVVALRICISARHVIEAASLGDAAVAKKAITAIGLTASALDALECASAVEAW